MNNISEIVKQDCRGCFACYNICKICAIKMVEDEFGSIYPKIDKNKCTQCGLCRKVCPVLDVDEKFNKPIKTYAMYNKNIDIRKKSSSGGIATTLYLHFLKNNGIVYGAGNIDNNKQIQFQRIENINDLHKIKESKYVHCYINEIFKMVEKDLLDNKEVLFIASPCQISGLKHYLRKDYDKLFLVDIICHGVPNQRLLFDELRKQKIKIDDVYKIGFRTEKGTYDIHIIDKNGNNLFQQDASKNCYIRNFLKGDIFRENCYKCDYAKSERISDITIGDFWGLNKNSKIYDDMKNGISVVMPITEKGDILLHKIFENVKYDERTIEEAKKENGQLNQPVVGSKSRKKFLKYYPKLGYVKTMKKMRSFKEKLKDNRIIYRIYKLKNKSTKGGNE